MATGVAAADPTWDMSLTMTKLHQKAATEAGARVIVGIKAGFTPEGHLSRSRAADQRHGIARAQSRLLERLRQHKIPLLREAIQFQTIPYLALTVDSAGLQMLLADPEVFSVQMDRRNKPALAQSVPLIGSPAAWQGGYAGQGQAVAVLDSGVDKYHPFLIDKVVSEACYSTNDASEQIFSVCPGGVTASVQPGSGMPCILDDCDHGTHVAGAVAGSNEAFAGVAREARIIAVQVFSRLDRQEDCGDYPAPCINAMDSDIIRGMEHVYELRNRYNIAAVNLSLGDDEYATDCDHDAPAYKTVVDNLRSAGIATIAASGNEHFINGISNPACVSSIVSVGATTKADQVAAYSNSAPILDLLAPGSDIYSSVPGSAYEDMDGTSMASPHVAGAWALLKSARPDASVDAILGALKNSGIPLTDSRNGLVRPRIQVDAALNLLRQNPSVMPGPRNHQSAMYYSAVAYPSVNAVAANAKPIGWGPAAAGGNMLDVQVTLNAFDAPVDLYFILHMPELGPDVLSWTGTTFEGVETMFGNPWKANIQEPVNVNVFEMIPSAGLPTLFLGLLAVPAGAMDMQSYYLWYTSQVVSFF